MVSVVLLVFGKSASVLPPFNRPGATILRLELALVTTINLINYYNSYHYNCNFMFPYDCI